MWTIHLTAISTIFVICFHPNSPSKSPILSAHHPGGKRNHRRNEADSISSTAIHVHLTV